MMRRCISARHARRRKEGGCGVGEEFNTPLPNGEREPILLFRGLGPRCRCIRKTAVRPRNTEPFYGSLAGVRGAAGRCSRSIFEAAADFLADLKPQACPEHFHGVEIKLGVERALDVGGLAEAMLLTRE